MLVSGFVPVAAGRRRRACSCVARTKRGVRRRGGGTAVGTGSGHGSGSGRARIFFILAGIFISTIACAAIGIFFVWVVSQGRGSSSQADDAGGDVSVAILKDGISNFTVR